MTKKEFISKTAALVWADAVDLIPDDAVKASEELADSLEVRGLAPWKDSDPRAEEKAKLFALAERAFERITAPPAEPVDLNFQPVSVIQVQHPGCPMAAIFRDIAEKLPPNANLIAGNWEIGFRMAASTERGLIKPGGRVN